MEADAVIECPALQDISATNAKKKSYAKKADDKAVLILQPISS